MAPATDWMGQLLAPWRQVASKADAFFEAVAGRHEREITCHVGCSGCCQQDLSVAIAEAVALLEALEALPVPRRRELARRAGAPGPPCALLVDDRCVAYEARPVICRTHGLPIRNARPGGPQVGCCPLNFSGRWGTDPAEIAAEVAPQDILDGDQLAAMSGVADALVREALGGIAPARVSIRELVRSGVSALPVAAAERLARLKPT